MKNQYGDEVETYPEPEDMTLHCAACGSCVEGLETHHCRRAQQQHDASRKPVRPGPYDILADPDSPDDSLPGPHPRAHSYRR